MVIKLGNQNFWELIKNEKLLVRKKNRKEKWAILQNESFIVLNVCIVSILHKELHSHI